VTILETERLILREGDDGDAGFILDLLNQPSFIEFIGDRGVRSLEQAREYIESRFTRSYRDNGFGLYAIVLKNDSNSSGAALVAGRGAGVPIGVCGFVKRDTLPDPDLGFALLPQFEKNGYAFEAAKAVMAHGREKLGLARILAITTLDNKASGRLLEKIGFAFEKEIEMGGEVLKLYSCELSEPPAVAEG